MEKDRWHTLFEEQLSSAQGMDELIDVVAPAARRLLAADGVTFVVREGDLCHYVNENAISPLWKGLQFPMSACISGWCMLNSKTAIVPDVYADSRIPHDAYRPTFVKSLIMAPVGIGDRIAAIGAYWADQQRFAPDTVHLLESLARSTAAAIKILQLHTFVEQSEERVALYRTASGLGSWELDIETCHLIASSICKLSFGQSRERQFNYADLVAAVHPKDRQRLTRAMSNAMEGGPPLAIKCRVIWPDNSVHLVKLYGRMLPSILGAARRMTGASRHIIKRKSIRHGQE